MVIDRQCRELFEIESRLPNLNISSQMQYLRRKAYEDIMCSLDFFREIRIIMQVELHFEYRMKPELYGDRR